MTLEALSRKAVGDTEKLFASARTDTAFFEETGEPFFGFQRMVPPLYSPEHHFILNSQKATALAAATFSESTPWRMGMRAA